MTYASDASSSPTGTRPDESLRHTLLFPAPTFEALRRELLGSSPIESATFLLAKPVRTAAGALRLLYSQHLSQTELEYSERSESEAQLPSQVVAAAAKRAKEANTALVLVHTHPMQRDPIPSARDLAGEALLYPALRRRLGRLPVARVILGRDSVHGALLGDSGTTPLSVYSLGTELLELTATASRDHSQAESGESIWDRQIRAFGAHGQTRLASMRVGIVGLGGTGSVVAQQLAHLGVGEFHLFDPDQVERTNLNRLVTARVQDIGRPKVDVAAEMIASIHHRAKVRRHRLDICDANAARLLLDTDFVFSCTDTHGSRAVLTQVAYQYLLPIIDMGVSVSKPKDDRIRSSGRVQALAHGLPCLICCGILDPEQVRRDLLTSTARSQDPYIIGTPTPEPAVISLNSATASMAVNMFVAMAAGFPGVARNQRLRFETGQGNAIVCAPKPSCPVCSPTGAAEKGDDWVKPGRPE